MLTLKQLFPCIKVRRSSRLQEKRSFCHVDDTALGYLDSIPLELKFLVFSYLKVEDLSILTITSKALRNIVEDYRHTPSGWRHALPYADVHRCLDTAEQAVYIKHFQRLGLLMKRSTCLYNTLIRLKIISEYAKKLLCLSSKSCHDISSCLSLLAFGTFLHTFTAGWDDTECRKVFDFVCTISSILKQTEKTFSARPGQYPHVEMHVRLFFRRVFTDVLRRHEDRAFWLSMIVKSLPMINQARMLYLLFGPASAGDVEWHDMCETTPQDALRTYHKFGPLADALQSLHQFNHWSEDTIISVIDEITSLPEDWLPENTAHLMILCGDAITVKLLGSKAINGRIRDISVTIAGLAVACYKNQFPISWVVSVIRKVSTYIEAQKDRLYFLNGIIDTFRENILELHEFSDHPDQDPELETTVSALSEFTKEIIMVSFTILTTRSPGSSSQSNVNLKMTGAKENKFTKSEE